MTGFFFTSCSTRVKPCITDKEQEQYLHQQLCRLMILSLQKHISAPGT